MGLRDNKISSDYQRLTDQSELRLEHRRLIQCPLFIVRKHPSQVNARRCKFIFESPKPELFSKWQEGKANVNALAFYNAYRELQARVYRD